MAGEAPSTAETLGSRQRTAERPPERVTRPPLPAPPPPDSGPSSRAPIRGELFGIERLELFGATLAAPTGSSPESRRGPGPPAAEAEPQGVARGLAPPGRRRPRRVAGEPRRRVAARQLPHRRGAAPRDPRGPAAAATTASCPKLADGPFAATRGSTPRLGFVAHTDSRFDIETLRAVRHGLPARSAAHHRRAVGGRDLAAPGAGREPAAARGPVVERRVRPRGGRRRWPTSSSAARTPEADPVRAR